MKIARIYRLLRLITMLQGKRTYTAQELADDLDVSRRTVFRDLNVLEMAHVPYYFHSDTGGYRIDPQFFLPPVNLTLTEALAMLGLTGRLRSSANFPLQAEAARAAVKLESILPEQIGRYVGSVLEKMTVQWTPVSRHAGGDQTFDELARALVDKCICRITYQSFYEGRVIQTAIRPLRLVFVERAWYVIAYSQQHSEVRTFKLVRIRELTVTKRHFTEPKDLDLGTYFGDAWRMIPEGKLWPIHLRFEKLVAGNVAEVQWHHSQQVTWNRDGSMEFHATVDGLGEITWWLLGYGDQVTVIDPPELRQRVTAVVEGVLARYRSEGSPDRSTKRAAAKRRNAGRAGP